ncbi:hypothetical protein BHF71_10690 [Vulcanibacillus modesticaldus]|uniref:HNH endonuclease n=1 Tax=Vulcanibacillus modesticaldus TaxID=337097 RepID=A0A1D2YT61_9BACI|nr:HNH endonuclease [Vulcanibacillus modesticaldus]OEF98855.1 hypothetical protein BHF71_10690 [Vulcanibacillus modesticaldus]
MRDDFNQKTKDTLYKRVGGFCSNPNCVVATTGPHSDNKKIKNIGVAAHITAAEEGGPRYDPNLSSKERKSIENGIWLCQNCAKLIDNDETLYPVELLLEWKKEAEKKAEDRIGKPFSYERKTEIRSLLPGLIEQLSQAIGDESDDNGEISIPEEYDIDKKIEYNNLKKYKFIVDDYGFYYDTCQTTLNAIDNLNPGSKKTLLNFINEKYKETLRNYVAQNAEQDKLSIVRNHSDDIIDDVKFNLITMELV